MTGDLFGYQYDDQTWIEPLSPGAMVLRRFALGRAAELIETLRGVVSQAPFRHLVTPGGFRMSVGMTNCGAMGWVSDLTGYRYQATDPESGRTWPSIPDAFLEIATSAAAQAGYENFEPDACLINRYVPGARLSLHQDRNERDLSQPIVSVSLGLPAVFLFGGPRRSDRPMRVALTHGDIAVWGGPARLHYHGILPLADGAHELTRSHRINLTFRKAG